MDKPYLLSTSPEIKERWMVVYTNSHGDREILGQDLNAKEAEECMSGICKQERHPPLNQLSLHSYTPLTRDGIITRLALNAAPAKRPKGH